MNLVKEKIAQAHDLLKELNIDCWILFVRETPMLEDPAMPLVVGNLAVVWQSFFIYTKKGDAIAVVGNFDKEDFIKSGNFSEVISYTEGVKEDFRKLIERLDPQQIALNYSMGNVAADGLTHGMYLQFCEYLEGTPYGERIISSNDILAKLRGRKLPEELKLLKQAATMADDVWQKVKSEINTGMTEIQAASVIEYFIKQFGGVLSFPTIVNAGSKTEAGHSMPTEAKITGGDLLHIDFGIRYKDFCSDIQRLMYFKRGNEKEPPGELIKAFNTVKDIITETGKISLPGKKGYEIDKLAREILTDKGYPEYQHALGHQLGRNVHDGAASIAPNWERYKGMSSIPLELNNVFTLELEIMLPGIGCVGLEEDMYVTDNGAEFLSPRQMELDVK